MNSNTDSSGVTPKVAGNPLRVKRGATASLEPQTAVRELHEQIKQDDAAFVIFYASSEFDRPALAREMKEQFGDVQLIGCTSGGEIGSLGYLERGMTAVSVASPECAMVTARIDNISDFTFAAGEDVGRELVAELRRRGLHPQGDNTFGFLLVDGLSKQEEPLVAALHRSIGGIQLFGGSASDGVKFQATHIYHDGEFHNNSAVFSLIFMPYPFVVFKTQHFTRSDTKLVVTKADSPTRTVTEINGEPAGREYARMVGLDDVEKLNPTIFAAHPVVVRVGGVDYVRSIMMVNEDESLTFACAIDEGIVLSVASSEDLLTNLETAFDEVRSQVGPPQLVLGCDCLFRTLEIDKKNLRDRVGKILKENNVVGFSTYGEQFNAMHVNQTFTGVAIGQRRAA